MDCIFCKIVRREAPARIVYEDEDVLAFKDVNPQAPVHILVIPKKHIANLAAMTEADEAVVGKMHLLMKGLAKEHSTYQCGFRVVANSGPDAGESIPHLHFHLLGGRKMHWPPG